MIIRDLDKTKSFTGKTKCSLKLCRKKCNPCINGKTMTVKGGCVIGTSTRFYPEDEISFVFEKLKERLMK